LDCVGIVQKDLRNRRADTQKGVLFPSANMADQNNSPCRLLAAYPFDSGFALSAASSRALMLAEAWPPLPVCGRHIAQAVEIDEGIAMAGSHS
jgi:hypothetical protein